MKRRSVRPLLRQALIASGLIACADETASSEGEEGEPELQAAAEGVEKRRIWVGVYLPEGADPKGPVTITLFSRDGKEPLLTKTVPRTGEQNQTVTWEPEVPLPVSLRAEVVVPFDGDPSTSEDLDYVGVGVGEPGRSPGVLMLPRVSTLTATLEPAVPQEPVYANTKGSHHYQEPPGETLPPKPRTQLRITRERPLIPAHVSTTLQVSLFVGDGDTPTYIDFVGVPRFPLDLGVFLPPGTSAPADARLELEISSAGGQERATLPLGVDGAKVAVVLKPQ